MTKKAKETHHLGKHTGYELIDGVYHIAPSYVDTFNRLADRASGIDRLLQSVTKHVAEINKEIAYDSRRLWDDLHEDLGLDRNKQYEYHPNGTIKMVEDTKDKLDKS